VPTCRQLRIDKTEPLPDDRLRERQVDCRGVRGFVQQAPVTGHFSMTKFDVMTWPTRRADCRALHVTYVEQMMLARRCVQLGTVAEGANDLLCELPDADVIDYD
jgi:hypothetical protein